MSQILIVRNRCVAGLASDPRFQNPKINVTAHDGDIKEKDLKLIAQKTPAVVVGISDVQGYQQFGGEVMVDCIFRIVIVTKQLGALDGAAMGLQVVDKTTRALKGKFWQDVDCKAPQGIKSAVRHHELLTTNGVSMWEMAFSQTITLKEEDPDSIWVDLKRIGITWDLQNPVPDGLADAQDLLEDMDLPLL